MTAAPGSAEAWPVWVRAALFGAMVGSGLLVGLLSAFIARPGHLAIARIMAFGAGALLATVSLELIISAQQHAGTTRVMFFVLAGALVFSCVNLWLARAGARHRKRCGECAAQANERDTPGSGQAIAVGTVLDAVPEGLVLGVAVAQGTSPAVAAIAGFFLANIPEAMSGSAGMYLAARSRRYILTVWAAASLVTPVAAVAGALVLANASPVMAGGLDALSAGILLAMAGETMIPEAFDKGPSFSGTVIALGFALIAALAALAR